MGGAFSPFQFARPPYRVIPMPTGFPETEATKIFLCPGGLPQEGATALGCMIYRSYVSWCKENGFFALNSRRFYAEFRKRFPQFWETPSKSGAVFHGVGLMVERNRMTPEEVL
jgi:phage/plasmid-associated DNA primase